MLCDLKTPQGETLTGTPWTVYPRPQMKRDSYLNLNGAWDFSVDYESKGQIRVPFCPESRLSGIGAHYDEGSLLCYTRSFTLPEGFNRGRVLLHIGAADQRADVFLNGKPVASTKADTRHFPSISRSFLRRKTDYKSAVLMIWRISPIPTASRP